ncbi:MAG TPA: ComEC/Rec2 family competence protein [Clostridia bacterium]|nr:ComEC/Rec2 family competence protein [Clostridia bacterium]
MKKFINFRPSLFCAVFLVAGILSGYTLIKTEYTLFCTAASLTLLAVILTLFFLKKSWKTVIVCVIFFFLGMGCVTFEKLSSDNRLQGDGYYTVTGEVSVDSVENTGYWTVYLVNATADGKKLDGDVFLFVSKTIGGEDTGIAYGSTITFNCFLKSVNIFRDGVDTYSYKNNVLYRATEIQLVSVEDGTPELSGRIKLYIKNLFSENMNEENAAIATALTLGDKTLLNADDKDAFQKSGTAHIFAVSGLHIGFVAGLFAFFVYKAKIDKRISFILVSVTVIFYGYIIGFPPSATRAIIMVISAAFLKAFGFRADMLSAMSLSAIIILLVKPLFIFDAGFLMSFGAVFGIATLTGMLSTTLFYSRLPKFFKRFADCVFVTIGATIGVLPALAAFYGEVFLLSVISNIIVIPVVSVVFVLLLVGIIPIPYLNYILLVPNSLISFLRQVTLFFSSIPYANVEINGLGFGAAALIFGLFLISPYVNLSKTKKLLSGVISLVLVVTLAFVASLPVSRQDSVTIYDMYPEKTLIATSGGEIIIISSFKSQYEITVIENYIKSVKNEKIYLVLEDGRDFDHSVATEIATLCGVDTIFILNNFPLAKDEQMLSASGIQAQYVFDTIGENMTFSRENGIGFDGYLLHIGGKDILIVDYVYESVFGSEKLYYDLVYIDTSFEIALECVEGQVISPIYSENYGIKSAYREGDFTFYFVFDKMILVD